MLLAIDAGNTNTVFAIIAGEAVIDKWRCATAPGRTGDEYFVWLSTLMNRHDLGGRIDAAIIASVVPKAVFNLKSLCNEYFGCTPLIVGSPDCRLPVAPRVDRGTNVGADRLVNATAAFRLYGPDLIVVDFGTATTFDVVDQDGAYIGGVIAPGVELSVKVLHEAAASLPHVDVTRTNRLIGKNTWDCLHAGVYWGYTSMIDGICKRIKAEHGRSMKVIGTGGLAGLFSKGETLFDEVNPNLTIQGLAIINKLNRA